MVLFRVFKTSTFYVFKLNKQQQHTYWNSSIENAIIGVRERKWRKGIIHTQIHTNKNKHQQQRKQHSHSMRISYKQQTKQVKEEKQTIVYNKSNKCIKREKNPSKKQQQQTTQHRK